MTRSFALKASLIYALVGSAHIALSDRFLAQVVDHDTFVVLQSYKGFAFVAVTAVCSTICCSAASGNAAPRRERGRRARPPSFRSRRR